MKIAVKFPTSFPGNSFNRSTFELVINGMFEDDSLDTLGFSDAATLAGIPTKDIRRARSAFDPLDDILFSSFKAGFLEELLAELGKTLGGVTLTVEHS